MWSRLWAALRVEDLLLVGVSAAAAPPLLASIDQEGFDLLFDAPPTAGLLYLAAALGAILCLATRNPGESPIDPQGAMTPRSYAPFPFLAALAMIAEAGLEALGLTPGDALMLPIFLLGTLALVYAKYLPTLPALARRALVLPFILIAGAVLDGIVADWGDALDFASLAEQAGEISGGELALIIGLPVLATLPFYVMLVFAPRQLADSEGSWVVWAARYLLFLLATSAGVGWLQALQA